MRHISFSGMLDADSTFEWIQYCESGDGKHWRLTYTSTLKSFNDRNKINASTAIQDLQR